MSEHRSNAFGFRDEHSVMLIQQVAVLEPLCAKRVEKSGVERDLQTLEGSLSLLRHHQDLEKQTLHLSIHPALLGAKHQYKKKKRRKKKASQ